MLLRLACLLANLLFKLLEVHALRREREEERCHQRVIARLQVQLRQNGRDIMRSGTQEWSKSADIIYFQPFN